MPPLLRQHWWQDCTSALRAAGCTPPFRTGALVVRSHSEQRVLASCWQPGREGEMPLTMSTEQVGESVGWHGGRDHVSSRDAMTPAPFEVAGHGAEPT